ncbi:hypothetical protein GCM10010492_36780 [Saccharothrix mutabilis subsp. mutabilis]|uniref:Uncharacterized protein n=1 Tax=Saccharothrix mutabilis subsp. mutabilis TaxID=66855 RepID=A0ABP3DNX8_9PSEU
MYLAAPDNVPTIVNQFKGDLDLGRYFVNTTRIIIDIVPNHCSDRHPRRRSTASAATGSGSTRATPPNDWKSRFGGPA